MASIYCKKWKIHNSQFEDFFWQPNHYYKFHDIFFCNIIPSNRTSLIILTDRQILPLNTAIFLYALLLGIHLFWIFRKGSLLIDFINYIFFSKTMETCWGNSENILESTENKSKSTCEFHFWNQTRHCFIGPCNSWNSPNSLKFIEGYRCNAIFNVLNCFLYFYF